MAERAVDVGVIKGHCCIEQASGEIQYQRSGDQSGLSPRRGCGRCAGAGISSAASGGSSAASGGRSTVREAREPTEED